MMKTLSKILLTLAALVTLASGASAITVRVLDRDLQGLFALGDSEGNKIVLRVAQDASGPVTILLIDDENVTSLTGTLRDNQIILDNPRGQTLARYLAGRGLTMTFERVNNKNRSFSLPGLNETKR
ncbi:hypothetical protein [Deinococcus yavapaiensis]|uniref:Uncharacterized protein n=1 Tax=Deinococcus yavapaiensis KR-236 TaxID=694435 RepID=A0A318S512_9DEIO|nr:hypothetical protein [Deinococcus yavapaiensis]PYE48404.1 hypothetical protein DES52_12923 [Deinococcus yavapaiensis KR-236]